MVHKVRYSEPTRLDIEQLKSRTITALERLGHQRFTSEPGGYSLENWMKGVSLLLDDFENTIGTEKLPLEYVERRRELTSWLSRPVDVSAIDDCISTVKLEKNEVMLKIDETRAQFSSRIVGLQDELARRSVELEEKKEQLTPSEGTGQRSESLFRRLFGRSAGPSLEDAAQDIKELEAEIRLLTDEMVKEQKTLKSIDRHPSESPCAEEWKKLQSLQTKLEGLETEKSEKLQLAKEREELTASIADTIARVP